MNQKYLQTPPGIMQVLNLFHTEKLSYLLFKCEHIFAGQNKNLDILFENDTDYYAAGEILVRNGFKLRFSEKIEIYKQMYCSIINNDICSIHLHREVAWHGIKALEKAPLFKHKQTINPLIIIPSTEDSILIHAGHVLFENFRITQKEKNYFDQIGPNAINRYDLSYIQSQIRNNGWKNSFDQVIRLPLGPIPSDLIIKTWIMKIMNKPALLPYILKKGILKIGRPFSWKRKGIMIAIIGPNGSGKTTLANNLFEKCKPITSHFHGEIGYYFGWDPILPTTKIAQKIQGKKGSYNYLNEKSSFNLFKEIIILYTFIDYLTRYFIHIYPSLRKGKVIITDRYYYDNYAQHAYAEKSIIQPMLLKIFPKPDFTYILTAPIETLTNRDKNTAIFSTTVTRSNIRTVHHKEDIDEQTRKYEILHQKLESTILKTEEKTKDNTAQIIKKAWEKIVLT